MNQSKKKRERTILSMVYKDTELIEVVEFESPDFNVRKNITDGYFGVEVTEFYYSQAHARLDNIPGYLGEILDEGKYRHKRDKKELDVVDLKIISEGKPDQIVRGIFQELPPVSAYVDIVSGIIKFKDNKFPDYEVGLSHVNLIIFDTENRLHDVPISEFYRYFFTQDFRTTIGGSKFREIYFITKMDNRWIYLPIKMLFLLSELYLFDGVLRKSYDDVPIKSHRDKLLLFSEYLVFTGIERVFLSLDDGGTEVIWDNNGVYVTEIGEVNLREYRDFPIPIDAGEASYKEDNSLINGRFLSRVR